MKEYKIINRCLIILKSSKIDLMTKLRMESLLIGIKMLLLVDNNRYDNVQDLEDLLTQVNEVCSGGSAEAMKGLLEHIKRMHATMAQCLNLTT